MKNYSFFLLALALSILSAINGVNAQVTIGELDNPDVTLDVRGQANVATASDGVLIPRLTGNELSAKDGAYSIAQHSALVYVTEAVTANPRTGKTINVKASGFYYYDANYNSGAGIWVALAVEKPAKPEWFYMPPCPIDVTENITGEEINLFDKYQESVTTLSVSSNSSISFSDYCDINSLTAADFDYYVVGYDTNLFNIISIDPDGKMIYDIIGKADDESYINIIFVRK